MLSNTLTTNEVKNQAGTALSFERIVSADHLTVFKNTAETIGMPHRLKIQHQTSGVGDKEVRRSLVRFDLTIENGQGIKGIVSAYLNLVVPTGLVEDLDSSKNCLANLLSFCASTGATSTILFDGTGNGAKALLNETL